MSAWEWSSEILCGGAGRDEGRPEGEMEERGVGEERIKGG